MGLKPVKVEIQVDGMDRDLRVAIWNIMNETFWAGLQTDQFLPERDGEVLKTIHTKYFKKPIDSLLYSWLWWQNELRDYILKAGWLKVYDIFEFIVDVWPDKQILENHFLPAFNNMLEEELSGYRFVGGFLTPIISEEEIAEIEEALLETNRIRPVRLQLEEALKKLSDRESPDYRGSIKESISAVETLARMITGKRKITLGRH